MNFDKEYKRLNPAQRTAVDQTDGTVLVVAGPGTGKTQLLAMRVANILQQTDAGAGDILCLTFTESAAANMTERLAKIIGSDAYKVAVNTFHSFGSEIISRWPQYFYNGALFRPADELATAEILREILVGLPHDNPLSATMNGELTYLHDVQRAIFDFRNAGLSPSEIKQILQQNLKFASAVLQEFRKTFENRVSKETIFLAENLLSTAERLAEEFENFSFAPLPNLAEIFSKNLKQALVEVAENSGKTTSLSNFKRNWATLDDNKNLILKDAKNSEKLLAAAEVYELYEVKLIEENLYDFDDMILRVTTAIEQNPDLKFDLQERFQYVLVDEFQDTNGAQMRLLRALTDYDSQPNLMVVGDDDQAIYQFQGADISNIQSFMAEFPGAKIITLTENYRSELKILTTAESVSTQIMERLANDEKIDKTLQQNIAGEGKIERIIAHNREQENSEIAKEIAKILKDSNANFSRESSDFPDNLVKNFSSSASTSLSPRTAPEKNSSKLYSENRSDSRENVGIAVNNASKKSIAVIARTHADLEQLLPYLTAQNIAVDYERQQSVLDSPPVEQLILLAEIVDCIAARRDAEADALLPKLLSFPAWRIPPLDIWKLSLAAKKDHKYWLEEMLLYSEETRQIAEWLIVMAARAQNEPLEPMLDELFGTPNFYGGEKLPTKTLVFSESMKITNKEISKTLSSHENDFMSSLFDYFFGEPGSVIANEVKQSRDKLGLASSLRATRSNPWIATATSRLAMTSLENRSEEFLDFIEALSTLRTKLRNWRPETKLYLSDFLDFINAAEEFHEPLTAARQKSSKNKVQLLTAHKAKGLEFDVVFIVNATSQRWGAKARRPADKLPRSHNLQLRASGDNDDERLRLLFVALTRARQQLIISSANSDGEKALLPVEYLLNKEIMPEKVLLPSPTAETISELQLAWHAPLTTPSQDLRAALAETLARYKLSATHLGNFLDITRGGPETFLMKNLLHFPEAKVSAAIFGSAVHTALQRAHTHLTARGDRKPLEDVLGDFTNALDDGDLSQRDHDFYLKKGIDTLNVFYETRGQTFTKTQRAEVSFAGENIAVGNLRLTGMIDLIDIDAESKTLTLTDYKTGKPAKTWQGKTEYEKIKLHHYRQQLMFYKLLIENSRQFSGYKIAQGIIEFVEPTPSNEIMRLTLDYDDSAEEMKEFEQLIAAVWARIMALDLPDITEFSTDFNGILEFEKALRKT